MNNNLLEIKKRIIEIFSRGRQIVIAGHTRPDGDCIGACFALGLALKAQGKDVYVLLESFTSKFECIPGIELLYSGDIRELEPDVFIACDCADKNRIGSGAGFLLDKADATICFDHHSTNTGFADLNIIDGNISSTCELVFHTVFDFLTMTRDVETAICAGIIFDTGGLRFDSVTPKTFRLVSDMLSRDVPVKKLLRSLIHEHSITESRALAKSIENTSMVDGYPILTSYISRDDLAEINALPKDLEDVVEYLSGTRGAEVTIFAYQRPNGDIKVSMRSSKIDVGKIAKSLGGGGHKLAAGFESQQSIKDVINCAVDIVKELIE